MASRTESELADTSEAIRAVGGDCVSIVGDVTVLEDVRRIVATVTAELGPVDLLVNGAGLVGEFAAPWESDVDTWWRTLEVNLRGPMLVTREVLPGMVARREGRIINIGSYVGVRPMPANIAYSTSKAALARYTDGLAAAVQEQGISVFIVSPGFVRTTMSAQIPGVDEMPPEAWTPIDNVVAYVLRLARGDADALTGRFLHVAADNLDKLLANRASIAERGLYQLRLLKEDGPVD